MTTSEQDLRDLGWDLDDYLTCDEGSPNHPEPLSIHVAAATARPHGSDQPERLVITDADSLEAVGANYIVATTDPTVPVRR